MAKSKRVSAPIVAITQEEFNAAMAEYAIADAQRTKIMAKMDMEITKIRERYAPELQTLDNGMQDCYGLLQDYCMANKAVLFARERHMDTAHGKVGLRLGTPKLKTLPKYNWEKVLANLKMVLPKYVRRVEEVDKEGLIADRKEADVAMHLSDIGVYVGQDEAFYVELKKEEDVI
jgi:phage host-nuclease inhibitor protein Gam